MFDVVAIVGRLQAGPHIAHEALLKYAASKVSSGGTLVVFLGSAHCWREPANPFFWPERTTVLQKVLERICESRIKYKIVPLRDRGDHLAWSNVLLTHLHETSPPETATYAICDASKNGMQSNYSDWFGRSASLLPFKLQEGVSATPYRKAYLREGSIPEKFSGIICPETFDFLKSWKQENPAAFQWLCEELHFLESFAHPLPDVCRQLIVCRDSILLCKRLSRPGLDQFDLPVLQNSFTTRGQTGSIFYPNGLELLAEKPETLHLVSDYFYGNDRRIQLLDIDSERAKDNFESWAPFYRVEDFSQRVSGLRRISCDNLPELRQLDNTIQAVWVPLKKMPTTPLFRRESLLVIQKALGFIPTKLPGTKLYI